LDRSCFKPSILSLIEARKTKERFIEPEFDRLGRIEVQPNLSYLRITSFRSVASSNHNAAFLVVLLTPFVFFRFPF
jgi:hypothetical protein